MSRLKVVAAAHWFTALSFIILFATLVNAFFQLVQPDYRLPLIGFFPPFEWLVEVFAWGGLHRHRRAGRDPAEEPPALGGRCGRAALALLRLHVLAGLLRRGDDLLRHGLHPAAARARGGVRRRGSSRRRRWRCTSRSRGGWPGFWSSMSLPTIANWVYVVATVKILISFAWMITISLQPTMGVAWHRFLAFPNIWFKREASGAHRARARPSRSRSAAGLSTWRPWRSSRRATRSAWARSRTSPGRACSTSRRVPSAAAASRSAPPGTPRSRSPPSC